MSQATKRKHVVKEALEELVVPTAQQQIVRVVGSPGNNLHEVEAPGGERFLASMPPKFRHNLWIKRGDFLLVDPIEEGEKVKAEISFVLYKDHVRYLQQEGLWPEAFSDAPNSRSSPQSRVGEPQATQEDEDSDSDLFVNPNRLRDIGTDSEEEDEDESEEEEQ
ncbi:PREDICTED: probable RNA-binding protein EIF1AD isoform X1 [Gavialis gangeticus]|uniref:probable RNA-binding protein EIF1AD isoform X1 n=1 Tax=Gavialis gangeticus TaxID=94835 RepID=UPI00092E2BDC|nr:PREDICTED: probable RNA-binding protein EIF1AD isoform X1 [Gavialis gangeticus]XP_019378952.1 PREDICTED: probable RNA-binding protein EIF1AD isoform X1 [Gavialis gangeticus]XP_019378953.1 PREDICTED: probable RNA-binding protein EIF1AD isoform X1 [Gavialis gangeticus]XP_019378954.1 PREDICTED: probable RNA-binding protein EIF1AD isoform X1 [Gavialis gangeticus]